MGAIKIKKTKEAAENNEVKSVAVAKTTGKRRWTDPAVVREDTEKTTAYSRRYVMNNGTVKTVYSAEPVNYYDEAEKRWKEIDGALTEKDDCYENACGNVKTEIFKPGRGKGAKVSKGDASVSWEFVGTKAERTTAKAVSSHKQTTLSVKNCEDEKTGRKKGRAVYENVSANTDIEYVLSKNNLKENIIVKERSEFYEYVFKLKTIGVKPELALDEKSIELKDEQGVQFSIPAPFMADAKGAESKEVYYELEQVDEETYTFTVKADEAWINAEERAFPVTIDPQIIVNSLGYFSKEVRKYMPSPTGIAAEIISSQYIEAGCDKTQNESVKTVLTVKRSLIPLMDEKIISAKLYVTPASSFLGELIINGVERYIESPNGEVSINIMDEMINNDGDFIVVFQANEAVQTFINAKFHYQEISPRIEIEAEEENIKHTEQSFDLAGIVSCNVKLSDFEYDFSFSDVKPQESVQGVSVSHLFKASNEDFGVGKNFRLNLQESFVKTGDGVYVYEDEKGIKHSCKEFFYYLNSSNIKNYVNQSDVTVSDDGKYYYDQTELSVERITPQGLKMITRNEGFKNSAYLEQRVEEEKQLEEQIYSYETALKDFVVFLSSNPDTKYELSNYIDTDENFATFVTRCGNSGEILLTKGERISYIAVKDDTSDLASRQRSLYVAKSEVYLEQIQRQYKNYVTLKSEYEKLKMQLPVNYLTNGTVIKGYNENGNLVSIQDLYENYAVIEYEKITIGESTKNRIVSVVDDKNNKVAFSYNKENLLSKISNPLGKTVDYVYNADGKLTEVLYNTGEHIVFEYGQAGEYNENDIVRVSEYKRGLVTDIALPPSYETDDFNMQFATFSYVKDIAKDSVTEISFEAPVRDITLAFVRNFINNAPDYVIITEKKKVEKYIFNGKFNLQEYIREEGGVVTQAKQYEYVPYYSGNQAQENPRNVVKRASKSTLNLTPISTFTFVAGEVETSTLNQFNNPVSKTTSNVRVNASGTNTATITTEYTYDNDQKLIAEKTTTVYTTPATTVVAHKKYNYNAMGSLIRTESYVEGEELTRGKNIEETVYDDKGRVTKSFTYNTLDTSSKFYTETAYSDDGKAISKADPTGEHKTEYDYVDGTDLIRTEKLANGSKLAYGHDFDGTVTAITQSTEDGVENSTQKLLRYGEVVELKSGNTKINYTYDDHRRVTKIGLNGNAEHITYTYTDDTSITDISGNNIVVDKVVKENLMGEVFTTFKDKNGRVRQEKSGSTTLVQVDYEKDKITKIKDNVLGSSEVMEYDEVGNKTQYTCGDYFENYEYNNFGKISVKRQSNGVRYEYNYSNNGAGELSGMSDSAFGGMSFKRDSLGRLTHKHQEFGLNRFYTKDYGYYKVGDHATNLINTITYYRNYALDSKLIYTYDGMGNIVSVNEDGKQVKKYEYDKLCRLIKETDIDKNKEISYTYDNNGNILTKTENGVVIKYGYLYNSDQLVSFGNESIDYNVYGNPTTYRDMVAEWERCGLLKSLSDGSATVSFSYDGKGLRRTKKVGDVTTTYMYVDGKIISETDGTNYIIYHYDAEGILGINLNGRLYMFRKNVFGDVTHIFSEGGELVGKYSYTAYGECTIELDVNGIATLNPIRYRSYYYDEEAGLYYLKSRYYDPEVGRFISIDSIDYVDPDTVNGLNLYAYCGNNPVMNVDPNGNSWVDALLATALIVVCITIAVVTAGAGIAGAAVISAAATGATVAGIISVVSQVKETGEVNIGHTLLDMAVGGVTGALTSPIITQAGLIGQSVGLSISHASIAGSTIGKVLGVNFLSNTSKFIGELIATFVVESFSNDIIGRAFGRDNSKEDNLFAGLNNTIIGKILLGWI